MSDNYMQGACDGNHQRLALSKAVTVRKEEVKVADDAGCRGWLCSLIDAQRMAAVIFSTLDQADGRPLVRLPLIVSFSLAVQTTTTHGDAGNLWGPGAR